MFDATAGVAWGEGTARGAFSFSLHLPTLRCLPFVTREEFSRFIPPFLSTHDYHMLVASTV